MGKTARNRIPPFDCQKAVWKKKKKQFDFRVAPMVRPEVYYLITLSKLKENLGLPFRESLLSTLGWIYGISFSSYNNAAGWAKLHF